MIWLIKKISLSVSDKIALKTIATKHKKTVSKMLHEWIIEFQQEEQLIKTRCNILSGFYVNYGL